MGTLNEDLPAIKPNDGFSNLITTLIAHRGTANGIATLDANARVPYSQLPESAME